MMNRYAFLNKFMENRWRGMNLQIFADGDGSGDGGDGTGDGTGDGNEPGGDPKTGGSKPGAKYTDEDVDKLLNQKFAKWQKEKEKAVSEAQKLANKNAEKKTEDRVKELEDKVAEYQHKQAHEEMMTQARSMLREEKINVSDKLLGHLVTEDAESTDAAIKEFVALYRADVAKGIKEQLHDTTPKTGSKGKLTKDDIKKIKDPIARQQAIRDNLSLFKK